MLRADSFLNYLRYERNYSEETVKAYEEDLRQFEKFGEEAIGVLTLPKIDAELVREWIVSLMDEGYASTSINRKLSSLRSFFKFLLRRGDVVSDPLRKVTGPKKGKALPVFLKEGEMNRLRDEQAVGRCGLRRRV